jgi:molybdopterin-guanine dinucleotide biosynthesis protein A
MGTPKASLEWHGSTLLRRVVGIVQRAQPGRVVVVRAPGQPLPALPATVDVLDDPREGRGPLQGIATGLSALEHDADAAFVCATDLPFLHPAFVRRALRAFGEPGQESTIDVALPVARGFPQPLAAAYRTHLGAVAQKLVDSDRLKAAFLLDECAVLRLDDALLLADADLRAADPKLRSLINLNDSADYLAARAAPAPQVTVQCFGVVAAGAAGRRGPREVRAATVADAAAAVGLTLDRHVLAAVNGEQTGRDLELPLVDGDAVAFLSADAGG